MPIRLVTSASVTPVAIATAIRQMRVLQEDADLVKFYLDAATEAVEDYTGRSIVTKVFALDLDRWPSTFNIELRRTPLIVIDSVKYYAEGATTLSTVPTTAYKADKVSTPGQMVWTDPAYELPDLDIRPDAVQIQFQAGYGTLESGIPSRLRWAVVTFARQMFEKQVPVGEAMAVELPFSLRFALRSLRVESLTVI